MATEVDIVNRALQKIGATRITSLAQNVKEAREASFLYDIVRDAELRAYNWRFAIRRASLTYLLPEPTTPYNPLTAYVPGDIADTYYCLAATTGNAPPNNAFWYNLVPEYGYTKAHLLPTDCLRLVNVGEWFQGGDIYDYVQSDTSEYSLEGRFILSKEEDPLVIRYVARIEDTAQYDALFVEALACKLALELVETIASSSSIADKVMMQHDQAIKRAIRMNAIEIPPAKVADDSWITGRL